MLKIPNAIIFYFCDCVMFRTPVCGPTGSSWARCPPIFRSSWWSMRSRATM